MLSPGASPWHYQGDPMKKTLKKLELAKETLRSLEKAELVNVGGGCATQTCGSCGARYCLEMPLEPC